MLIIIRSSVDPLVLTIIRFSVFVRQVYSMVQEPHTRKDIFYFKKKHGDVINSDRCLHISANRMFAHRYWLVVQVLQSNYHNP
jgi:hypothetical protein